MRHRLTIFFFLFLLAAVGISQPVVTVTDLSGCNGVCDGQLTAAVTGGVTPYTYEWDDPMVQTDSTATNLCAGNYTIMVIDAAGDTVYASGTIVNHPVLTSSIMVQQVDCYDSCSGMAWFDATSGGLAPYTYTWDDPLVQTSDTAYNLCSDSICGTITDSAGCSITQCDFITQPMQPIVTVTTFDASGPFSCDGYAVVTVTGGTPPYSMDFMGSGYPYDSIFSSTIIIDSLCPGDYWFMILDASGCGCTPGNGPYGFSLGYGGGGCSPPWVAMETNCGACDGFITLNMDSLANCANGPFTASIEGPGGSQSGSMSYTGLCAGNYYLEVSDGDGNTYGFSLSMPEPIIVFNLGIVPDTCSYCVGYVDLIPDPAVTYSGSYSGIHCDGEGAMIYALDTNGCEDSMQVWIYSVPTVPVTATSVDAQCNGVCDGVGEALGGMGSPGSPPYTYEWYNEGTFITTGDSVNLCADDYMYEVWAIDADGCYGSATVLINEPPPIYIGAGMLTQNLCDGDANAEASAVATGGTPGFSYSWSNGATGPIANNLVAGNYTVTVFDNNGCVHDTTISVWDPAPLAAFPNVIDPTCYGDCNGIIIPNIAGGTPGYSYNWSTGSTFTALAGLCDGSYGLTVTDANGCIYVQGYTLTEPSQLTVSMSYTPDFGPSGIGTGTAIPSGGVPPYSYLWNDPLAQTTATATGLWPNVYSVVITDANGCIVVGNVTVDEAVSVNESEVISRAVVYPNPVTTDLNVSLSLLKSSVVHFEIHNSLGQLVYATRETELTAGDQLVLIPIAEKIKESGIYLLTIFVNEHALTQLISVSK